jgi:hypothetical protein
MRTIRRALSASLVPLFLCGVACDKKERQAPPGPPPLPALAKTERPVHQGVAPTPMPADHPPLLRPRSETEPEAMPAAAAPSPSPSGAGAIRGTIRLADKLKDKAPAGAAIFLVARAVPAGATAGVGPPVAVQRYAVGSWPQNFELTQDNVMIAGTRLEGRVVLSARVDQDGDAMTKQVGDIEGATPPISVPAQGVDLVLDTVRTQAAGGPSPPNMGGGGGAMPPGHPALPPGHPTP